MHTLVANEIYYWISLAARLLLWKALTTILLSAGCTEKGLSIKALELLQPARENHDSKCGEKNNALLSTIQLVSLY